MLLVPGTTSWLVHSFRPVEHGLVAAEPLLAIRSLVACPDPFQAALPCCGPCPSSGKISTNNPINETDTTSQTPKKAEHGPLRAGKRQTLGHPWEPWRRTRAVQLTNVGQEQEDAAFLTTAQIKTELVKFGSKNTFLAKLSMKFLVMRVRKLKQNKKKTMLGKILSWQCSFNWCKMWWNWL